MWRNIFGHAFYQITVLMLLLVWGRDWFNLPYENDDDLFASQAFLDKIAEEDPTRLSEFTLDEATNKCHVYTIVFQAFVMMQIFNMINARKLLNDELNVFASFFNNFRFVFILILILVVQLILVQYGGRSFKTTRLDWDEQMICVGIGAFTIIWGVIIKLIMPPRAFDCLSIDEKEIDDQEALETFQSQLRRSYRHSRTMRESKVAVKNELDKLSEDA